MQNRSTTLALALALTTAALAGGCQATPEPEVTQSATPEHVTDVNDGLLHLDTTKEYGDRFADGLLPVGDEKWSTTTASIGTIYLCHDNFVPDSQAGAQNRGPWFVNGNTQWDSTAKVSIAGSVNWNAEFSARVSGAQRVISTNDLPDHHTGVFPVGRSDPARVYDANPNTITAQSLTYELPANPTPGEPTCMGGEVGVMLTGVALFNGFDAGGRDAGAWEVQDSCDGHPQGAGEYHYHSLSRCITDIGVDTVIGFALDGFPITGPVIDEGNVLTTADLDECHGIVSEIELDGELVTSYHYVMTQDFPYSASCFRGTATAAPGQQGGGQDGGQEGGDQPPPPGDGQQNPPPPPPPPGKTP